MEGGQSIFKQPWNDGLISLNVQFTALERAVLECACAGCESIWITVNYDNAPLIKSILGDYVEDPYWISHRYDPRPSEIKKRIPVFYVPLHPDDMGTRDSVGWGIINSALNANYVAGKISKHLMADMFYAAFPMGVYDPWSVHNHRPKNSSHTNFHITHNSKSFKDNEYLGFTFSQKQLLEVKAYVKKEGTLRRKSLGEYKQGEKWVEKLPISEQYSARRFAIDKVFNKVPVNAENKIEVPWYYKLEDWHSYKEYMSSPNEIRRPIRKIFGKNRKLNPVGVDDD